MQISTGKFTPNPRTGKAPPALCVWRWRPSRIDMIKGSGAQWCVSLPCLSCVHPAGCLLRDTETWVCRPVGLVHGGDRERVF